MKQKNEIYTLEKQICFCIPASIIVCVMEIYFPILCENVIISFLSHDLFIL